MSRKTRKTDKTGTENKNLKKRWFASHRPGMPWTVHPKVEKKYTLSVSVRTKIQPYQFPFL